MLPADESLTHKELVLHTQLRKPNPGGLASTLGALELSKDVQERLEAQEAQEVAAAADAAERQAAAAAAKNGKGKKRNTGKKPTAPQRPDGMTATDFEKLRQFCMLASCE